MKTEKEGTIVGCIKRSIIGLPSLLWHYFVTGQVGLLRTLTKTFLEYVKGERYMPCAIVERAKDVDGLAQLLWLLDAPKSNPDEWNRSTQRLKQPYLENARAVLNHLTRKGE